MPVKKVTVNGVRLAYLEEGTGPETIVFSHSYLVDHRQFEAQIEALKDRYRIIAFDHRGHGESEKPASGYEMENLYADAVGLLEATSATPCHFVGLSTGGFIALRLGLRRPDLLRSLVVMDASADAEPRLKQIKYRAMFAILRVFGFRPIIETTMKLMLGKRLRKDPARRDVVEMWKQRMMANDPMALIRFGKGIFARKAVSDRLEAIRVPTLIVVGEDDPATPPFRARRMANGIPGAQLEVIPGGGHLCTVGEPDAVTAVLTAFFDKHRAEAT